MAKMIEDELQDVLTRARNTADNFNAVTQTVMVPLDLLEDLLERAIKEIKHMRLSVGAVTSGESFDDIAARAGRHPKEERV